MRKRGRRTGQRKKVVSKKNKVKKRLNGGIRMSDERKEKQLECYIALTIERKLKAYSESPGHTDRHEFYGMNGTIINAGLRNFRNSFCLHFLPIADMMCLIQKRSFIILKCF